MAKEKNNIFNVEVFTVASDSIQYLISNIRSIFGSFKTKIEFLSTNGITPPKNWTNFENYKVAFSQGQILTGFKTL